MYHQLAASSLWWGIQTVEPWLDILENMAPMDKLLIVPMRDFGRNQRTSYRGDALCLLPLLAGRRWPGLRIVVMEELPELADLCREVMRHNHLLGIYVLIGRPMLQDDV